MSFCGLWAISELRKCNGQFIRKKHLREKREKGGKKEKKKEKKRKIYITCDIDFSTFLVNFLLGAKM